MNQLPRRGPVRHAFAAGPAGTRWPDDLDLILVLLGSLFAGIAFAFDLPLWLRLPLGLIATLALPGYSASMALLPPGRLDGVERSALAFSLSIGLIVLVAPLVNLAPGGFSERAVVGAITVITSGATAVAWWRRLNLPAAGDEGSSSSAPALLRPSDARRRLGVVAVGLLGLTVLGLIARDEAAPPPTATEFFLVRGGGPTEGVPTHVVTGRPTRVTVGIANHEASTQEFTIVLESGSERLTKVGPITVEPDTIWTGRVAFTLPSPGTGVEVRILLFRGSERQPYRALRLVVDAVPPA